MIETMRGSWYLLKTLGLITIVVDNSDNHSKEIKPVNPKGNQPWIFTGRTYAEGPILWPPNVKSWFIGKDPDAGKDGGQEKGVAEDKMVGWHHWLNGHEFEQTSGDSEGQGSLASCSSRGFRELGMT